MAGDIAVGETGQSPSRILLYLVKKLSLPLNVQSTALVLSGIFGSHFRYAPSDLSILCLFLACKFEDIHGTLERLMLMSLELLRELPAADSSIGTLDCIVRQEAPLLEYLDFDFVFPSLYTKAKAMEMLCREAGLEPDWRAACHNIDALMCNKHIIGEIGLIYQSDKSELDKFLNALVFEALNVPDWPVEHWPVKMEKKHLSRIKGLLGQI